MSSLLFFMFYLAACPHTYKDLQVEKCSKNSVLIVNMSILHLIYSIFFGEINLNT